MSVALGVRFSSLWCTVPCGSAGSIRREYAKAAVLVSSRLPITKTNDVSQKRQWDQRWATLAGVGVARTWAGRISAQW